VVIVFSFLLKNKIMILVWFTLFEACMITITTMVVSGNRKESWNSRFGKNRVGSGT